MTPTSYRHAAQATPTCSTSQSQAFLLKIHKADERKGLRFVFTGEKLMTTDEFPEPVLTATVRLTCSAARLKDESAVT